jgi:tetratricopeptide (TPR) repeat protein
MTNLDKNQIDLLKALAELFYDKIRPDTRFRNKRIEEWCDSLPPPPTSSTDSNDALAINKIAKIHQRLERLDDENSVKAYRWGGYVIDKFSEELSLLRETIENHDVDPSILNLFHVHNAVLLRAQSRYDEALEALNKSSALLQQKIDSHGVYLPRYTREIYLNIGASSELHRLNGSIDEAISTADTMHKLSMRESEKREYADADKDSLCLSTSWALYYCCEAHLAVVNWDDARSQRDREWYFSQTFSHHIYRDWTVPVQIRIIGNVIWEQRYPEYRDKIVDLVYIDTAKGKMKKLMRETSVLFGRIRLKPTMPLTLLTLVALLAIKSESAYADERDTQRAQDYTTPVITAPCVRVVVASIESETWGR